MTKKEKKPQETPVDESTGTYVYDKEKGKVVKVSSRVPKVSSKGQGGSFDDAPMPSGGCASCPSGGACGMGGMGGMGPMGGF